ARPRAIGPHVHDRILATVSHLPHVLANLLVAEADATLSEEGEPLPATGPSFRDATRVAGVPSSIWTDIYLSNSEALIRRIEGVERRLREVREMLFDGDAERLTEWNDLAAEQRVRVSEQAVSGGPAQSLRVRVPNRAGVLAEVALALGGAGIDLVDLQLHPAADRATGTIVLWIEGSEAKDRAAQLIASLGHVVI
ncbi:MAG: prephenate dehydrogenase dimerization domain-containing protein, partial [Actinomycetes bacterium]